MNENARVAITTGKQLLDSGITKFEVINGAWIGEVVIRNNQPHLYCTDYNGTLINSFTLHNSSELRLIIRPLSRRKLDFNPNDRLAESEYIVDDNGDIRFAGFSLIKED